MLGTANDYDGVEKRQMNRAINRHRWDYPSLNELLADADTEQSQVLTALSELLRVRAKQPAFHPNATQFTIPLDERLFGLWRQSLDRRQSIFALHNVSGDTIEVETEALNLIDDEHWIDLVNRKPVKLHSPTFTLAPYQCCWISNRDE